MTATLCHNSPRSGTLGSIRYHAYPSPSPSPTSRSYVTVDSFCSLDQPYRPSTTTLCSQTSSTLSFKTNTHLPASPLDALVMALEATAGEMEGVIDQSPPSSPLATSACSTLSDQSDLEAVELRVSSDPENSNNEVDIANTSASVLLSNPSDSKSHSETVAKPKCHTVASLLQHIPSLALSESTAAVVLALASLPPIALPPIMGPIESESCSSHWPTAGGQSSSVVNMPAEPRSNPEYGHRRMSSSSSSSSCSGDSSSCSTSTKAYACSAANCGKRFCQASSLRIHERCHTGARPFVCRFDGCERSFTQLGNLKTHERKHTGERPYKCLHPGCDKAFTQLGNLKTHEHIHDEVKPFLCRVEGCGKTFSQLGNLKTHTIKIHPDAGISDEKLAVTSRTRAKSIVPTATYSAISPRSAAIGVFASPTAGAIGPLITTSQVQKQDSKQELKQNPMQYIKRDLKPEQNSESRAEPKPESKLEPKPEPKYEIRQHSPIPEMGAATEAAHDNSCQGWSHSSPPMKPHQLEWEEQRVANPMLVQFHPYQRRPIRPQPSEAASLLKTIRDMIRHQSQRHKRDRQHPRQLLDESEVSEMEE